MISLLGKFILTVIYLFKTVMLGSSHCGSAVTNPTGIHEEGSSIPGPAPWVRDPALLELWRRLQMWLGSCVAVAVV